LKSKTFKDLEIKDLQKTLKSKTFKDLEIEDLYRHQNQKPLRPSNQILYKDSKHLIPLPIFLKGKN